MEQLTDSKLEKKYVKAVYSHPAYLIYMQSTSCETWSGLSVSALPRAWKPGKWWCSRAMAPHSSTLARRIPWTEEPGGLQSMGSLRVGHDGATSLSLFTFMHWRRKWQPTPVFLPGESQGQWGLVRCRLWGRRESDTTERLHFPFSLSCIGEGNGNPLQCSCLENPRDRGAW